MHLNSRPFSAGRASRAVLVGLLLVIAATFAANADETTESEKPVESGKGSSTLTLYLENDFFLGLDSEYTSGVGFSWVSDLASSYSDRHLVSKTVGLASFLKPVSDPERKKFVSFTLSQEMYTPSDISSPVPPPDQQPYAGILALDTGVYAHGDGTMHEFTLRLGCVGPCSAAEYSQIKIHEWIGAPIPRGWDHQLSNEPLLNLGYEYYQRWVKANPAKAFELDLTYQIGASLGNYHTGANAGLLARLGTGIPDSYGSASLRTGGASRFVGPSAPAGQDWQAFGFVSANTYLIARFLPSDGNTFKDSPSVERDDLTVMFSAGVVIGWKRLLLTWSLSHLAGYNELTTGKASDFGTLALSYHIPRRN